MSLKKMKILIVDDNVGHTKMLENMLEDEGYNSEIANDGKTALSKLDKNGFDLVLLDLKLPDISGMKILGKIKDKNQPAQVVMISGQGSIPIALEATRIGAYDFLEKPLDTDRVLTTIRNALEKGRLEKEKTKLLETVKGRFVMVGESAPMKEIKEMILKAAAIDSKVLIEGENGTGKELVARLIYINSKRVAGPFVAVNCAAIPETLIESELFGHVKGAFTGAVSDKIGRFQMADEGTLFFDEVGDMSIMTQAKVLRVLEEGVIEMVGGSEPIETDVRVIAATNKDLQAAMKTGKFREDLYFRLNVINIKIPPLRERKEDIPILIEHFIRNNCEEHGIPPKEITPRAMNRLQNYSWPGNVRELRNTVEKLIVFVEHDKIKPYDISSVMSNRTKSEPISKKSSTLKDAKLEFEKELIRKRLIANDWNITKTARTLDIPRTYLHTKINKFGIKM
jgi:two-component system nitrogen regulation response regulator NtrX